VWLISLTALTIEQRQIYYELSMASPGPTPVRAIADPQRLGRQHAPVEADDPIQALLQSWGAQDGDSAPAALFGEKAILRGEPIPPPGDYLGGCRAEVVARGDATAGLPGQTSRARAQRSTIYSLGMRNRRVAILAGSRNLSTHHARRIFPFKLCR